MKIAYFDCIAGVSGDMILGALIDAGLPPETLIEKLSALHLIDFELKFSRADKNSIGAAKVDVLVSDDAPERHLPEINALVENSDLPEHIKKTAVAIFRRIGECEADIHGSKIDHVHLHELGGVDSIIDVVGALVGLDALGIEAVYASPLPMGRGFIQAAHGKIPLPAPATIRLLEGVPIVGSDIDRELVTPTGAAILSHLVTGWGEIPPMLLTASGMGAGDWDLPIPNVLRLLIGEQAQAETGQVERLITMECNIDDMNPELYAYAMDKLFAAGALDVTLLPVQMKKNRPATIISVLCRPEKGMELRQILFAETSTIGIRQHEVKRYALKRRFEMVETEYGRIKVKIVQFNNKKERRTPEYEECRRAAEEYSVPLQEIYQAALA